MHGTINRQRSAEPLWWERARQLRNKGLSLTAIGRLCGFKHHTTVLHAIDPEFRVRKKLKQSPTLKRSVPRDNGRDSVVRAARDEARETGQHVDQVLIAWGEPPRHSRTLRRETR